MSNPTTKAASHPTDESQVQLPVIPPGHAGEQPVEVPQPAATPPKFRHFVLKTAYVAAKEMDMEQMPALCGVWVWTEDKGPYRERPHCRECLAIAFELGEL